MSWAKVKLGNIADFSNGINFAKDAYAKGIKLIGVSNFGNKFNPDYDELEEVREDVVRETDCLQTGDIVFVRSNGNKELVGRCMLVDNPPAKLTFSGFCIRARLKNIEEHNPIFWAYHFKSQGFRRSISGTAIGANIQNLSQGRLAAYEAEVPDIDTQKRIADILSKYDDLIENNQKQIELLEEAAQRLYKEWFVELRFPGYETCKIVDGVPVGWKRVGIDEAFDINYGKTLPTSKISSKGKYPVYGANGIIGYYEQKNCDECVTLITSRGNGSGDVLRTHDRESFVTNNSFIVNGKEDYLCMPFLYEMMTHTNFKSVCSGSAQPQLTKNSISTLDVIIPEKQVIRKYNDIVADYFDKIEVLLKQNEKIIEARNRLLPKLMNGEIEV